MDNEADRHRWLYHVWTLRHALEDAAHWSLMVPFSWRYVSGADIARDWWVLAVEAFK